MSKPTIELTKRNLAMNNTTVKEADSDIIKNVEEGNYQLGQATLF
jgi:hypothetical protein